MSEPLRIYTLGGLKILEGEKPVSGLETRKVEALLVYLACTRRAHSREVLANLLWDERSQVNALGNLRVLLANLRKRLGGYLVIQREAIALDPEAEIWLDVVELERLLSSQQKGKALTDAQAAGQVERAVALYRGDFLEGFYVRDSTGFEDWRVREQERLHRLAVDGLHDLVDFDLRTGETKAGLAHASRLLELDPLMEEAHCQMMQLLVNNGRRSEALSQYGVCVRLLRDELGVEPSKATQELYEKIRHGEIVQTAPAGQAARGYDLEDKIGEGSFGIVYRASQSGVGRKVAVKVIRPEYANDPEFIRRFEAEAQLVARLEHPHIVPLYDYWRDVQGAYLVMRWLRGGNLADEAVRGPLAPDRVAQMIEQVAAGLDAAHRQGIIHRDLKPENILLDEVGNAYLSDFGIAKDLRAKMKGTAAGALVGSPVYMSPEQIRSQPVSPRSDIFSLGVLLYELLSGELPFPVDSLGALIDKQLHEPLPSLCSSHPDLPPAVDEVLLRATAKEPASRYPDILAFSQAVRYAVEGIPFTRVLVSWPEPTILNPYKGLRPFQEADAADFFGREALTERLLGRLSEERPLARFLAVVGPSGSGKSSVVKAGVIPSLRSGGLRGADRWFIVEMLPGRHPLEELEVGLLRVAAHPLPNLMEHLRRDERGLSRAARLALPTEDSELFLVIDQFEEVFTLVDDKAEAKHFLNLLYQAVVEPRSRVRVLITLRADFYDRPLMYPDFSRIVQERTEVVIPLTIEELERAIIGPAERVGVSLEPGLATAIVAEVVEQPGALPLLQYALTELFGLRQDHSLTNAIYASLGGVLGVLGRRAEEIFGSLNDADQGAARQLFFRLVTLGEGTEDTRRRALQAELEAVAFEKPIETQQQPDMARVIDAFGRARLLTFDHDPLTRSPTVEVAHEALLREWRRLRQWLEESRADVRMQRVVGNAAADWREGGRDPSFLLRGARLEQYAGWAMVTHVALTREERDFLEASLVEREARRYAEAERQRREAALERRSRNFLRALVAVLLVAVIGTTFLAWTARRQANLTFSRELALASINNLQVDPERSILLALQGLSVAHTKEAENALHRAVQESHVKLVIGESGKTPEVASIAYSPDGARLASSYKDGAVKVWDAHSGDELLALPNQTGTVKSVAFSSDGARLVTAGDDETARIWDAASGKEILAIQTEFPIDSAKFSPDGTLLGTSLTASITETVVTIWDAFTGREALTLQEAGNFDFSPDGSRLVTGGNPARLWDLATGKELLKLGSGEFPVFSPDGSQIAMTEPGPKVILWDAAKGQELRTFEGHISNVIQITFSSDGARLATAGQDGLAKVWDVTTGEELLNLAGHPSAVNGVAFDPTCVSPPDSPFKWCGVNLATAGEDGTVRVWDVSPAGSREQLTLPGFIGLFSQDGSMVITEDLVDATTGIMQYWDATGASRKRLRANLLENSGAVFNGATSADGNHFALITAEKKDPTVNIWDGSGNKLISFTILGAVIDPKTEIALNLDGSRLAVPGQSSSVQVWDTTSGRELSSFSTGQKFEAYAIAYSPDGARLAVGSLEGTLEILDSATGKLLRQFPAHSDLIYIVKFSPDGKRLVTGSRDGSAKIWDAASGQELQNFHGHSASLFDVSFNADGSLIGTASLDGTAKVWKATTGEELLTLTGHTDRLYSIFFSPDGSRVATGSFYDGTVRVYLLRIEDLINLARSRLTRWFTPEECKQYLHVDQCPRRP